MKILRYAAILAAMVLVPAVYSFLTNGTPFLLMVVDENGRAIPRVQVSTDNGIICYTNNEGHVTWTESSLMNRRVRFFINAPGYRLPDGDSILVMHGRRAELKVPRTTS
jgi:hypothetical protein